MTEVQFLWTTGSQWVNALITNQKNALLDFHIPVHCNGINNIHEVQFVLTEVNKLLIQFEKETTADGDVLGVSNGNWFDNPSQKCLSDYK